MIMQINLKKSLDWTWNNLDYLARLGLTLRYMDLDMKNIQTVFLYSVWFQDILDLDLKCSWTPQF